MNKFTTLTLSTAAGIALVIGGGAVAAHAASPSPSPKSSTSSASCTFLGHLRAAWGAAPADLKSDLKAARAATGADRKTDLTNIRTKALSGGYGAAVEVKAEWLKDHKGQKLRPLPANLKTDLKTLHGDSKADKPAEAKKIADNALAGTYGANVESFAKAVQSSTLWQDCQAGS